MRSPLRRQAGHDGKLATRFGGHVAEHQEFASAERPAAGLAVGPDFRSNSYKLLAQLLDVLRAKILVKRPHQMFFFQCIFSVVRQVPGR